MKNSILILLLIVSLSCFGQQWQGATNNTGLIYRDGNVILGGNTVMGNYGSNWKFIELHDEGILSIGPSSNNRIQLYYSSYGGGLSSSSTLAVTATGGLKFQTNGDWQNDKMTILPNGSVGIGTENPDANFKLSVNGSIRSKEVKVEANWSDFVFYDNYELRTLEEVEEHIAENGHLPEIPSEAEVTENGVNLGEMDAKLLLKIEELTLYMIDMNKRMSQLETENGELKEKVQSLENK